MEKIKIVDAAALRGDIPQFRPGDTVRVHVRVREAQKERIQVFEGVVIARSGGGGAVSTLSGDEVAGKGSGVATLAKGKGRGKVRGKVTKMSSGLKVQGRLSREEISRVVNAHINAIQACYERALMGNPTLSGRIVFDWTVTKRGTVKNVRVRSSTIGSSKVANCISGLIKRWRFPKPKGGDVVVTYPFLFRSVSS